MTQLVPAPVSTYGHLGPADLCDPRPVLALVDLEAPIEPVLRRAAAAAAALDAPLRVVVLHPRSGFTTDPAIAARIARRLDAEHRDVVTLVTDVADDRGLKGVEVCRVPYARLPFGGRARRARRAAMRQQRGTAARLVVAAVHLSGSDDGRDR